VSVTVLPPNVGPEVVITSPSAGKGVSVGATLKVSVTVSDSDGDVTEVEFLSGDESLAKRSEAPYEVDWRLAKPGLQSLTVKATDNDGAVTEAIVSVAAYGETPVPVDGLRLWLDAGSGLTTGADSVVSGWGDQSHFGHDLGQAELGLQPTLVADAVNGKPALLFDGEDDVLARADVAGANLLSPDEVSVFAVVRQKWQSKVNTVVAWEAPNYKNHMALLTSYNNKFLIDYGHASEGGRVSADQPEGWDDEWHVLEFARAGNLSTVKVDGESVEMGEFGDSLEVDASGMLSVGAVPKLAFGGEIAEVLIYNRTLSAGEQKSVTDHLGVKYGFIEGEVPVDPTAPTLSAAQVTENGQFRFLVTGDKGGKVVLQYSENLGKWIDLQTYTNETGELWIPVNITEDASRLFFRVRAE